MILSLVINGDLKILDKTYKEVLVLVELILSEIEQWIFDLVTAIKTLQELRWLLLMSGSDIIIQTLLDSFGMEQIVSVICEQL